MNLPARAGYRARMPPIGGFERPGSASTGARRPARAAAALLLLALAAACSELRPDLLRVYPDAADRPRRPVIIIPGVFGSRLKDQRTGEVVWGRFTNLLTSRFKLILNPARVEAADLLDLPIDSARLEENRDNLVAYDLFDAVAGREFYRRIVRTLTGVAGYRLGDVAAPRAGEDCFAFYYDWRRDIVENARLLGEAIARVRAVAGGPDTRVDLIAHSQGGLIARYYIKYGARDVLDAEDAGPDYAGAGDVHTLVMIGVPNAGTLDTLQSHNEGIRIGRRLPPEAIFTMPASYQLLPHAHVRPFLDASGAPLAVDLYRPEVWEEHGWSAFGPRNLERLREEVDRQFGRLEGKRRYEERLASMRAFLGSALERARRLHVALDRPGEAPDTVRYFAFGGDCNPSPARAVILQEEDGARRTITRPDELPRRLDTPEIRRLMSEPGDGSVTRASLLGRDAAQEAAGGGLRIDYSLFLCAPHRNLTENVTFQDNLLQFLLYRR